MEVMRTFKDKQFDLAIVDPPYGIKKGAKNAPDDLKKYGDLDGVNDWKPTPDYFRELFRVSKNQIIWGYNHLSDMLPTCTEFIFWYKRNAFITYSDGELAWTSFKGTAVCIDLLYAGNHRAGDTVRIHPTQKPVKLYERLLNKYAKPGMTILDTFGGSMSSMIASYRGGYSATCIEIDPTYYRKGLERLQSEAEHPTLFQTEPEQIEQLNLL